MYHHVAVCLIVNGPKNRMGFDLGQLNAVDDEDAIFLSIAQNREALSHRLQRCLGRSSPLLPVVLRWSEINGHAAYFSYSDAHARSSVVLSCCSR